MNLPNKLTILRVIMIPFFVAALLYDGGANQNMRYVAAALFIIAIAVLVSVVRGEA